MASKHAATINWLASTVRDLRAKVGALELQRGPCKPASQVISISIFDHLPEPHQLRAKVGALELQRGPCKPASQVISISIFDHLPEPHQAPVYPISSHHWNIHAAVFVPSDSGSPGSANQFQATSFQTVSKNIVDRNQKNDAVDSKVNLVTAIEFDADSFVLKPSAADDVLHDQRARPVNVHCESPWNDESLRHQSVVSEVADFGIAQCTGCWEFLPFRCISTLHVCKHCVDCYSIEMPVYSSTACPPPTTNQKRQCLRTQGSPKLEHARSDEKTLAELIDRLSMLPRSEALCTLIDSGFTEDEAIWKMKEISEQAKRKRANTGIPAKPEPPPTAYQLFMRTMRPSMSGPVAEIAKELSMRWSTMPSADRSHMK
eukprot:TRINITY_DN1618_c0_g2_i1.p1 TRINITY_DN1618_c0_g2~~TRINITY_DN1618_c0_g2_i1.p1  ORF type:complete len:393 (-),score=29.69 TRINITY_DN1618_c0_g2_i1:396-1517(-)